MLHDLAERAACLNEALDGADAQRVMNLALTDARLGKIALVSSFGAESAVLLHMAAQVDTGVPVLFLQTGMHFPETLAYQRELAAHLGLTNVRLIEPDADIDPDGDLHQRDPDQCCHLRKTVPLERALEGFDGWITGRKRHQTGTRAAMPRFETEGVRLKINPLANWGPRDPAAYMERHNLPRHPLVSQGFPSIGCAPCTSRVAAGEDARAGRWRGQDKAECGIHIIGGKIVPAAALGGAR